MEIANSIYREFIPRELTFSIQVTLSRISHAVVFAGFLQRIVNGGGRIEREYGLGMQRTDLLVVWLGVDGNPFDPNSKQRMVIVLKRLRPKDGADSILERGLQHRLWIFLNYEKDEMTRKKRGMHNIIYKDESYQPIILNQRV